SAGASLELTVGSLAVVPDVAIAPADVKTHPAARAGEAAVDVVHARQRTLDREYFPHITLQATIAARGTGAEVPGVPTYGNVPNWAIGASVTFPALDFLSINARKKVEAQNELAESARYDQTIQALTTQDAKARALLKAASEIATNTPVER